nr:dynein assembly factor 4, axonemal [Halyomorpha halys]
MPILIKDYSWRQTEQLVIVRVPLRNIPHTKVDLFNSDIYMKVHFPPFLFECCLFEPINEDESKCTIVEGEAVFELVKNENKVWPTLNKEVTKQEMTQIKKEAIEHAQKRNKEQIEKKKDKIRERRDACIGQQIALDTKKRETIQDKKDSEKRIALGDIMEWKEKETDDSFLPSPLKKATALIKSLKDQKVKGILNQDVKVSNEIGKSEEEGESKEEGNKTDRVLENSKEIWKSDEVCYNKMSKEVKDVSRLKKPFENKSKNINEDVLPALRQSGLINVGFTYRAFPTPSRESTYQQEQEWLIKQKEARRKTGFMAEDLRPEENDPIWLLEKGKSFHEAENYLGAISAFTHALRTWDKIPELYVARSHSQLCIGNLRRVLEDTCDAIGLLKPHVESNAELRFQAHYNRGKALLELGKPKSALADFEDALEIHPYRNDIHNLMDRAEADIEAEKAAKPPNEQEKEGNVEPEYIEPEVLAN